MVAFMKQRTRQKATPKNGMNLDDADIDVFDDVDSDQQFLDMAGYRSV
jgi:hypothetical protein